MGIPGLSALLGNLTQNQKPNDEKTNYDSYHIYNNLLPCNQYLILRGVLESFGAQHALNSERENMFSVTILNESVECFYVLVEKGFTVQYCSTIFLPMARQLRGTKIIPILIERNEFPHKEDVLNAMIGEVKKTWFLFPLDENVRSYIDKLEEFKNQLSLRERVGIEAMERRGNQYKSKDRTQLTQERQKKMEVLKQIQQIHDMEQLQNQMHAQRRQNREQQEEEDNDLKRKNGDSMEY